MLFSARTEEGVLPVVSFSLFFPNRTTKTKENVEDIARNDDLFCFMNR